MNKIVRDVQAESLFGLPTSMPLVLDLDGTLIAGDLLYKSFVSILRRKPFVAEAAHALGRPILELSGRVGS
jgi:hypothetical protein